MNIQDNNETRACGFSDLVVDELYYRVSVGMIHPITYLKDLNGVKFEYGYNSIEYLTSMYYSDCGVWDAPKCSYQNLLNRLFKSREDAEKYVASPEYQKLLKQHERLMY